MGKTDEYRLFLENYQGIAYKSRLSTWTPSIFDGAVAEITGYEPADFIAGNPSWDRVVHPDDLPELPGSDELRTVPNYSVRREYRIIRKDGDVRWVRECTRNVCDESGRPVSIQGTIEDITDRVRTERALRESEKRYGSLFENNHSAMLLIDPESADIVDANPAACEFYGWPRETLTQKKITDINTLTHEEIVNEMQLAKSERRTHFLFKHRLASGEERDVEVYSGPIRVYERELLYSVVHDITDRIRAEADRERLRRQLFHSRKMDAVATLAGGIAHQFNNALYVITGNVDLLESGYDYGERILKYTEPMKKTVRRMVELTNQLLAYARGGKYQTRPVSFYHFLKETLPLLKHNMKPGIRLETDFTGNLFSVNVDMAQMQMVLSSAFSNAAEAMSGKGLIRVACKNAEIEESNGKMYPEAKRGPYVCLTIEDDGKGMDEETRRRIFEPFFTTKFQGRGLGMAAAYGIVKNHGGWISIDSGPGSGTIVRVFLPAIKTETEKVKEPKAEPVRGRGTILVVEDEAMVMDVSQTMLEDLGYEALPATTGEEAVDIANTFDGNIDLAILDIVLPDMAAKDIYTQLMQARPGLKVVLCSGYSVNGPANEILNAGAQRFIQKPFSFTEFSKIIKEVLEISENNGK